MKNLLLLLLVSLAYISCSGDDADNGQNSDSTDYFPITETSFWEYNYQNSNQGNSNSGQFPAMMEGSVVFDGKIYQVLDNTTYLTGSSNMIFVQKSLNKEITLRPIVEFLGLSLDFEDVAFIKNVMQPGQLLKSTTLQITSESAAIPEGHNLSGTITPVISITLHSRHIDKNSEMRINGQLYENICHNQLSYDIEIEYLIDATYNSGNQQIPIQLNHQLLGNQTFGNLEIWLAKEKGIIKTDYSYSFQNLEMNTTIQTAGLSLDLMEIQPNLLDFNQSLNNIGNASLISYTP
ncbi:MAG: hypothetical protein Q4G27_10505 [Flavobacteriaceae bacterium]|nr:hypothetical protein [Flavobacteriaceae bacterium]